MRGPKDFLKPLDQAGKETVQRIVAQIESDFGDGMTLKVEFDITSNSRFPPELLSVWRDVLRLAREAGWNATRTDGRIVIKYPDEA